MLAASQKVTSVLPATSLNAQKIDRPLHPYLAQHTITMSTSPEIIAIPLQAFLHPSTFLRTVQPGCWEDPIRHPSGWTYLYCNRFNVVCEGGDVYYTPLFRIYPGIQDIIARRLGITNNRSLEFYFPDSHNPSSLLIIDHEHKALVDPRRRHSDGWATGTTYSTYLQSRDYWRYIERHPAHHPPKQFQKIIEDGVQEALDYLAWCSQAAVLPSDAPRSTFSQAQSEELVNLVARVRARPNFEKWKDEDENKSESKSEFDNSDKTEREEWARERERKEGEREREREKSARGKDRWIEAVQKSCARTRDPEGERERWWAVEVPSSEPSDWENWRTIQEAERDMWEKRKEEVESELEELKRLREEMDSEWKREERENGKELLEWEWEWEERERRRERKEEERKIEEQETEETEKMRRRSEWEKKEKKKRKWMEEWLEERKKELEKHIAKERDPVCSFSHAVSVSAIAAVLANKYDLYNEKHFWDSDRKTFFQDPASHDRSAVVKTFVESYFLACSTILLFTPRRYLSALKQINKLFVTGDEWRSHLQRLTKDWQSFTLLATIMLAASVSVLSAEGIGSTTSAAALISTLCALGSVLSGFYCLAYYRAHGLTSTDGVKDAAIGEQYVDNIFGQGKSRPRYVAIILSLPEACLLWSFISFGVAALSYNLTGGRFTVGVVFVVTVFSVVALATAFVFGFMWYVWGEGSIATRIYYFLTVPVTSRDEEPDVEARGEQSRGVLSWLRRTVFPSLPWFRGT
ncbi:unnamed protein product [Cyclocybe aegerita]|uniref:Uncharacterized protein n=1 Tax=Cyclocybe aegerita TaxID=1973307 RepID=A0A8S0W0I7_CYCAE|nr:unnamed protein product [Cyclocybe aegerita]